MFGIRAIRYQKRLEVIVELEIWDEKAEYTRTGLDESFVKILDSDIPYVKLPIIPGKNITVISEVIAMNHMLKVYGQNPAQEFSRRLIDEMKRKHKTAGYLESDFE